MRIVRIILIILSILLIAFNGISYMAETGFQFPKNETMSNKIAYYVGRNLGFIIAGLLLIIVYVLGREMTMQKKKKMVDSLFKD